MNDAPGLGAGLDANAPDMLSSQESRQSHQLRFVLKIANYEHLKSAYGGHVAKVVFDSLIATLSQAFRDRGLIEPAEDGMIDFHVSDSRDVGFEMSEAACIHWLYTLSSRVAAMPIATNAGHLRAVLTGAWIAGGIDDISDLRDASPERILEVRECLPFTGDPPQADKGWHGRYRADMALANDILPTLCIGFPGSMDSRLSVLAWQPVRHSNLPADILFFDAGPGLDMPRNALCETDIYLAALGRLGLSGVSERFVGVRALDELREYPSLALCVAVSPRSARKDGLFFNAVMPVLRHDPALARRLIVEIDGGAAFLDIGAAVQFCDDLRKAGCTIAMGDFGSGYSSIRDIIAIRPDIIRLGRFFVRHAERVLGANGADAFAHLVGLSRALAGLVVADGVEREEQATRVQALEVEWQQGLFWGEASHYRPWRAGGEFAGCGLAQGLTSQKVPNALGGLL